MESITIDVPSGFIIDEENSSFTCIKFKKEERKKVTCWEELKQIKGYYVDRNSNVAFYVDLPVRYNKNTFATKEQAEASIALAMLSQLMKEVNGEWIPNWEDASIIFVIEVYRDSLRTDYYSSIHRFLCFPTEEIRDTFLLNHEQLIMKAKPLL